MSDELKRLSDEAWVKITEFSGLHLVSPSRCAKSKEVFDAALAEAYRLGKAAWIERVQGWIGGLRRKAEGASSIKYDLSRSEIQTWNDAADYIENELAKIHEKTPPK